MSQSEFLRDLANRLENGQDCVKLREIANDIENRTGLIFREASLAEAHNMDRYLRSPEGRAQQNGPASLPGEQILGASEPCTLGTLNLTREMQLPTDPEDLDILVDQMNEVPPDGATTDELQIFDNFHSRDLVAEVRNEIKNAIQNGYDMLGDHDDEYVALDLMGCTEEFQCASLKLMERVVGLVRADPVGIYPND